VHPGGFIKLKNDLPNNLTISDVEVSRANNGKKVAEFLNTIPNGGEEVLGFFNTGHDYMVTFKARKDNGKPIDYKYTQHPSIMLSPKQTTTVFANSDFSAQLGCESRRCRKRKYRLSNRDIGSQSVLHFVSQILSETGNPSYGVNKSARFVF